MLSYKKTFVLYLLAIALITNPVFTSAANDDAERILRNKKTPDPAVMIVDLVVARPVGLVATLGGTAFFILSLPFSALGGNTEDALESLVKSPANYTFQRPLGEFDD